MRLSTLWTIGLLILVVIAVPAYAGPCDAYYRFEGNLEDSSGSGHGGQMIGKGGVLATPTFVPGHDGQALRLDGSAAMRVFMDLNAESCPQVTVAAWINVEPNPNQMFFAVSHGLHMKASNTHMGLRTGGQDLWAENVVYPNGGWMFIAGTWDMNAQTAAFFWRGRIVERAMGPTIKEVPPAVWFGALNDQLQFAAKEMIIDEVRIVGRALTRDQLVAMQNSGAGPAVAMAAGGSSGPAIAAQSSAIPESSCASHADCSGASYCAVDGTCHPQDHMPMPASGGGSGTTLADIQAQMAARNAERMPDIDYTSPVPTLPADSGGSGTSLEDLQAQMAARNAERTPDFQYESPIPELSGGTSSGTASTGSGGTSGGDQPGTAQQGMQGPTVGEVLRMPVTIPEPHGDVRDCTSFAEITGRMVSDLRDAAVATASAVACPLLAAPVAGTLAAATALRRTASLVYDDPNFQIDLLMETIRGCRSAAQSFSTLPDRAVTFWNNNISSGGWATIGPRGLLIGQAVNGNLISPGDRKFVTMMPKLFEDDASLRLDELAGQARVTARVCKVSLLNEYTLMRTFSVNETPGERDNENQTIVWDLNGIQAHYLIVVLDASGLVGRNFRYEMLID